ncbi:MAG: amidohydrolase family protein [Defluviitaleaceae bacterium]|nr:amidohydrolase family protein [Defluviitaleaceae bacterium]
MNFVLKGNICYSKTLQELEIKENSYLICEGGISKGVFSKIPDKYIGLPVTDYSDNIIIPGLCDLHIHAPQYTFRGLGMNLQLLDWLNTHTFVEESRYDDLDYADKAYSAFVEDLKLSAVTRASIFATLHTSATILLMEKLEKTGLITMVGKVNMDRNSSDILCEESPQKSYENTKKWIEEVIGKFKNTTPIITPRFIPTCTDELLTKLKELQKTYKLPVQSHLSESKKEIEWVKELYPDSESYGDAYNQFGLFGGKDTPTIMAHCVWSKDSEEDLLKNQDVYVAHCPQSNTNLSSGIAPIRRFLKRGIHIGLGSDVAAGCHTSIFRAMSDAIQVSKLYWRLVDQEDEPLTENEAFYLGTLGGGSFFGKVGSFDEGYEFDAIVIDDSSLATPYKSPQKLTIEDRLAKIIYFHNDNSIRGKYVRGNKII